MSGRITRRDIKTEAELVALGATAAELPNDSQVWVDAKGINKTLHQAIEDNDIGGGGGGVISITKNRVTGQTGATVTFTNSFTAGKGANFYRNGKKMFLVTSFGGNTVTAADEYMEVDAGIGSTQITLSTYAQASSDEIFEFEFLSSGATVNPLAEKNFFSARGAGDGSSNERCTISQVNNKTRVTFTAFTYTMDFNSGYTKGALNVIVNGQVIERKVTGVNDVVGNIVYDEVSTSAIDIYVVGTPNSSPLQNDTIINVEYIFYTVAQTDAVATDLKPATDNTKDIGDLTHRFRDIYAGRYVRIGSAGMLRISPTTGMLEFSKDSGTTWGPVGSGGGAGMDELQTLNSDELGTLVGVESGVFIDDFNQTGKGTKIQTAEIASALRLIAGQIAGTYERQSEVSPTLGSVDGLVVPSIQNLSPKNTAISANTIKFQGDVTEFFVVGKNVKVSKKITADGQLQIIDLFGADNSLALFNVNARSYSSVNDETTLVLDNPNSLDLSMGISSSSYNGTLMFSPFDYQFQVKATNAGTYETMVIKDSGIYNPPTVRIPGENFFVELGSLAGTVQKFDAVMSPNKQYGFARVWMKTAGNSIFYWFYTTDHGHSWIQHATTKDHGGTGAEEFSKSHHYFHSGQLVVADNGKAFSAYLRWSGSQYGMGGIYTDLSAPSPIITDTPSTGSGAGWITVSGSSAQYGRVVATPTLDFIAFIVLTNGSVGFIQWFTNGGSIWYGGSSDTWSCQGETPVQGAITGTAGSYRTHIFFRNNADAYLHHRYYDQPSLSATSDYVSANTTSIPISSKTQNNRVVHAIRDGNNSSFLMQTGTVNGTPSMDARKTLSILNPDYYVGCTSAATQNFYKVNNRTVVLNPTNEKHAFIVGDLTHPDGIVRSHLFEIVDVTDYLGIQISNYTAPSEGAFVRADYPMIAQTFTSSGSTRLRTATFKFHQVAPNTSGNIICELQQTDAGTGQPNGVVIATSLNSFDQNKISKSSSHQLVYFNFNTPILNGSGNPGGLLYALVLKLASGGVYGSGSCNWAENPTSVYSGGKVWQHNTSVWTDRGSDSWFQINGEWVTDLSAQNGATDIQTAFQSQISPFGIATHNHESQIELLDSTNIQWITRKAYSLVDANRLGTGHPFRRTIAIGNGTIKSVVSDAKVAGYAVSNYDPFLALNVSYGHPACADQDLNTGALSQKYQDRSGLNYNVNGGSFTGMEQADTDFSSGMCWLFPGATRYVGYNNSPALGFVSTKPYIIEFEIKPVIEASQRNIFADSTTGNWGTSIWINESNNAGGIAIYHCDSSGNVIGRARTNAGFATSGYQIIRITYAGDGSYPRIWRATSVGGAFIEATYVTTLNFSGNAAQTSRSHYVGAGPGPAMFYNGKLGYLKIANGVTSFVYDGFKSQPPLVAIQNLGSRLIAKQNVGYNWFALNNNFQNAGIISGDAAQAAVVDSYDQLLRFSHTLAVQGKQPNFKLSMGRGSDRNQSSIQGLLMKFLKV